MEITLSKMVLATSLELQGASSYFIFGHDLGTVLEDNVVIVAILPLLPHSIPKLLEIGRVI